MISVNTIIILPIFSGFSIDTWATLYWSLESSITINQLYKYQVYVLLLDANGISQGTINNRMLINIVIIWTTGAYPMVITIFIPLCPLQSQVSSWSQLLNQPTCSSP